jgi:RHS repeat-associated protein
MNGSGWKYFQRNMKQDFEEYSTEDVVNIDGFGIRPTAEILLDDICLSGARTEYVYNISPNVPGGLIMSKKTLGAPQSRWYHYDPIGNVASISNVSGMLEGYDQDSFGLIYGIYDITGNYVQGSKYGIPISPDMQHGYHQTTKQYDLRTNMYDFNFRLYDPVIGRFIQQEPLGLDGPNPYHFNFNNPVNSYDPNGLFNLSNPFTWGV